MLRQAIEEPWRDHLTRTPHLDPRMNQNWGPGVCQAYMEQMVVVLPRMTRFHVEDNRVVGCVGRRRENESDEEYTHRRKWRSFHQVMLDQVNPLPHGFLTGSTDQLEHHQKRCLELGVDPYDPMDNEECTGHHASTWARRMMYETAVGIQSYPLELCLSEDFLDELTDNRGADYICRLYINPHEYDRAMETMLHRGPVYFNNLRYENEAGDFVPWALSTIGVMNATYRALWFDHANFYLEEMHKFAIGLATDIQDSTFPERAVARWDYLQHLLTCEGCNRYSHTQGEPGKTRDKLGLDFISSQQYAVLHRLLRRNLERSPSQGEPWMFYYLTALIPSGHYPGYTEEYALVMALHQIGEVTSYIMEFAECIGAVVDPRSQVTRRRTFTIYMHTIMSLMCFSPTWKRSMNWKPSKTDTSIGTIVPRVQLSNNHRYQKYLHFLTLRSLYYHADPIVVNDHWVETDREGEQAPMQS